MPGFTRGGKWGPRPAWATARMPQRGMGAPPCTSTDADLGVRSGCAHRTPFAQGWPPELRVGAGTVPPRCTQLPPHAGGRQCCRGRGRPCVSVQCCYNGGQQLGFTTIEVYPLRAAEATRPRPRCRQALPGPLPAWCGCWWSRAALCCSVAGLPRVSSSFLSLDSGPRLLPA